MAQISSRLKTAARLHAAVPPDWYESSVATTFLQRFWHARRFAAVGKYSAHLTGQKVLDIGSADGLFTAEILRVTRAAKVIGIDVLPKSVAYARQRYRQEKRLHFQVADAHKLPFPAKTFAAVYCLEAMEHVLDPGLVLRQICRVLKPGGYTVVLVPSENWLFRLGWPVWLATRGRVWQDTHLSFFTGTKLPQLMASSGFTQITTHRFLLGMLLLVRAYKF